VQPVRDADCVVAAPTPDRATTTTIDRKDRRTDREAYPVRVVPTRRRGEFVDPVRDRGV
jgi:hypothetical protein